MSAVVVAGGLGDMGRLITSALVETGKYEVYVISRRVPNKVESLKSPITGAQYSPIIQSDYSSEVELAKILEQYKIHTVICTFALDFQAASDSQVTLIRASERSSTVKRFIPSEFNVDYDLPDSILPYPDKKFHIIGRRELEKTQLEFTYIYPGMFMDYFAMPNLETHLRELCIVIDNTNRVAYVPGDGEAKMAMTYTKDVARYTALALEMQTWPRVLTTTASTLTINQLVALIEKNLGEKIEVTYESIETLEKHDNKVLPRNIPLADHFPEGLEQVKALAADLGASIALGAYDFDTLKDATNLVDEFKDKTEPPTTIERLLEQAFKGNK
ncbi:unnamed protein product [Clonostachys rosea f. rosea IK726]|uniref:NmrA-like domain-containing protein n=2 Tax=Bionectria ochroleuca TaxID=29856 RepID=A0A0B7KA92_BIOOC|nr:unnamed protein product [Clonostachys rosea f. rosea IK726]